MKYSNLPRDISIRLSVQEVGMYVSLNEPRNSPLSKSALWGILRNFPLFPLCQCFAWKESVQNHVFFLDDRNESCLVATWEVFAQLLPCRIINTDRTDRMCSSKPLRYLVWTHSWMVSSCSTIFLNKMIYQHLSFFKPFLSMIILYPIPPCSQSL